MGCPLRRRPFWYSNWYALLTCFTNQELNVLSLQYHRQQQRYECPFFTAHHERLGCLILKASTSGVLIISFFLFSTKDQKWNNSFKLKTCKECSEGFTQVYSHTQECASNYLLRYVQVIKSFVLWFQNA